MLLFTNLIVGVSRLTVLALVCSFAVASLSCSAQQELLQPQSTLKPVQLTAGPTKVNLGNTLEISVPEGVKFVAAEGARLILNRMTNPAPKDLLGLMIPDSGGWYAILQFADIGFVNGADKQELDAAAILKTVRHNVARQNQQYSSAPVTDVDWEIKPTYDPQSKVLEYAIRAGTPGEVNYHVCVLGRRGVVAVVGVYRHQAGFDLAPIRQMVKGIAFKQGARYADHQQDDRVARTSLSDLVASDDDASSLINTVLTQVKTNGLWGGVGLALVFAGWRLTALAVRNRKASRFGVYRRKSPVSPTQPTVEPVAAARKALPSPAPSLVKASRNGRISRLKGKRRRKQFSYQAFYSDMVMSLTRCNYVGAFGSYAAPESEEHEGVTRRPSAGEVAMPDTARILVVETSKLLESQQKLIEGQRRLIEEQSKLIQEKSKLIDVETRVLEKQAELFVDQQLL